LEEREEGQISYIIAARLYEPIQKASKAEYQSSSGLKKAQNGHCSAEDSRSSESNRQAVAAITGQRHLQPGPILLFHH